MSTGIPPAVVTVCERGLSRACLRMLWAACSGMALLLWLTPWLMMSALATSLSTDPLVPLAAGTTGVALGGWLGWHWHRRVVASAVAGERLRWDGAAWRLGTDERYGHGWPQVLLNLDRQLLLRWRRDDGHDSDTARLLWLRQADDPAAWHGLRVALLHAGEPGLARQPGASA